MIPAQFRMARAALTWTIQDLALKSGVHRNTIIKIESGMASHKPTITCVIQALEDAGLEFIGNNGVSIKPGFEMPGRLDRVFDIQSTGQLKKASRTSWLPKIF